MYPHEHIPVYTHMSLVSQLVFFCSTIEAIQNDQCIAAGPMAGNTTVQNVWLVV